jgi:hypothetical protein
MIGNTSNFMIRCAVVLIALLLLAPAAVAQKSKRQRAPKTQPEIPTQSNPPVSEAEKKQLSEAAAQSRAHLLAASTAYRESLERLLALQKQDEERIAASIEKQRQLLALGVIAKREMEENEQLLGDARSRVAETQRQLGEVDHLVAEVNAAEELAKLPPAPQGIYRSAGLLIRYLGASRWALGDFGKLDAFFRLKFGKPLPVSAIGQTDTHNRLGFDHQDAVDVAVHPDSAEGGELINYLASQGISFIAIRGAIPGSATGAHIHIGPPSKRTVAH